MKTRLIQLLTDAKGRLVSLSAGLAVGAVTKFFADRSWTLDPKDEGYIVVIVSLIVGWAIDSVIIKLNSDGVKRIQDALPENIASDGVPGEKTIAAVEKAVSESQNQT